MEDFWKGIDTPAKHSSERGLNKWPGLTSQNSSIYEDQCHDLKEHSKVAYEGRSSKSLKIDFLKIPLSEIKDATNDFNKACFVGEGGYADVYRAELDVLDIESLSSLEGKSCKEDLPKIKKIVAIKKFKDRPDEQAKQGFLTEIELLTSCKHPNIISLLGFSEENDVLILVYEFAVNGSLGDYLKDDGKKVNLSWTQRLRICLDTANGINYLHTDMEGKRRIIHRDIKSDNILLDENLNAKVADFGLSKFHPMKQQAETVRTKTIVGTEIYMDPVYWSTFKYKTETDTYSFGVVLFEVLCGRLAYDSIYTDENRMGLAPIAKRHVKERTLKELIDPKLIEEVHNEIFTLNRGLDQDPFEAFSKIAHQCLADAQGGRPTMQVIIKELQDALNLQEFKSATNKFSTILSATNNFSNENLIWEGASGNLYKGQLLWNGNLMNFTVRRLDCTHGQGDELQTEVSTLRSLKHKNIISILGHYDANDEKIIIYEQAFHGTLDQHLKDPTFTWSQRLQICVGVAHALSFIHSDVIHCDINSSKIILDKDWEPKIYGFELSTIYPQSWRHRLLYSRYFNNNKMTPNYDVYSFRLLLLEVLCGWKIKNTNDVAWDKLDAIIDANLRIQMGTESLRRFTDLVYKCLDQRLVHIPTTGLIVHELEQVLDLQRKHANLENLKAANELVTSSNKMKMDFLNIPMSEIKSATKDFDSAGVVASGGYADVYYATLAVLDILSLSSLEGKFKKIRKNVAIKRIRNNAHAQDVQTFLREVDLVTSCKHPNLVPLLGFCIEDGEMILVYEFCFRGSLRKNFMDARTPFNHTWAQRIQFCLDIAHGINYLHTHMEGKPRILHRDVKSDNIFLDENLKPKLGDFGFSKSYKETHITIYTNHFGGTMSYTDPEYLSTGKYKRESDTYSFGVVLFEILSGRMSYDPIYTYENDIGLAPMARRLFKEGTLKKLIDPKMTEEDDRVFTLNRGPNQDSFDAFTNIAYQCLAETQAKRPTMEVVIKELQNALRLQGETVVLSRFQLSDIVLATGNFAETCIGSDLNGTVYKAELDHFGNDSLLAAEGMNNNEPTKKRTTVAIKRITSRKGVQGKQGFLEELEMRAYKHPNIVPLLGLCDEGDEMIIVYEHVSDRSLDEYLKSVDKMDNFTCTHRLHMCLEIARGLAHLHSKTVNHSPIRIDIRSANILLDKNREAKIAYFVISNLLPANQEMEIKVYEDPEYETHKVERKSDIYSLGVVLFEIFCGRVAYDPVYIKENEKGLAPIARQCFNDGTIHRIMDPRLKEETGHDDISTSNTGADQDSLDTFLKIVYQCLGEAAKRPTIEIVIKELESALKHVSFDR